MNFASYDDPPEYEDDDHYGDCPCSQCRYNDWSANPSDWSDYSSMQAECLE